MANWRRWADVTSTLAPLSQMPTMPPFMAGRMGQKAGRMTPGMRPRRTSAPVTRAPVEPVETRAAMSSWSLSMMIPFIMEELRLRRTTSVGFSSQPITSGAWTISRRWASYAFPASSFCKICSSPSRRIYRSLFLARAARAPSTGASGLLSPPKQSTSILIIPISLRMLYIVYTLHSGSGATGSGWRNCLPGSGWYRPT